MNSVGKVLSFVRSNAVPAAVLGLLIATHYVATWVDRTFHFPPFDTYLLFALWAWCGWQVMRREAAPVRLPIAVPARAS